jgi:hypothetical protein
MTVTAVTYRRAEDVTRVFATSDLVGTVFFHWYLDGSWLGSTTTSWRDIAIVAGEQARVDVIDTTDVDFDPIANAPVGYPARRSLWWVRSADTDVSHYVVEQKKDAGSFEVVARVAQLDDAWSLAWLSDRLEDLSTYAWRVTPYDRVGNEGTSTTFGPEKVVRRPDALDFDFAFDDLTGFVTFSEPA